MQRILTLILLVSSIAYGQEIKYRFQTAFSIQTIVNAGTRSFEDVSKKNNEFSIYEQERYNIDYKNNTASLGFNWKFGINWVVEKDYSLRQTFSVFGEMYQEQIDFELTAHYGEKINNYPNSENVVPGYTGTAILNGLGYGAQTEFLYLFHLNKGWKVGGGLSLVSRFRNDIILNQANYVPNFQHLTYGHYWTKQAGISAHIEKATDRWIYFLNFNQAAATMKNFYSKGGKYFEEGEVLHPISHNMDFRFPFTIQFGAAVQFRKTRK